MNFETIAQLVHFHRKKAGISRNYLADIAEVGKTVIFDIEHGKESVQFHSLSKVLAALNIQLDFKSPFKTEFMNNQKLEI
jgi:HTH-type transcriptional regulator / antitoxin HipB